MKVTLLSLLVTMISAVVNGTVEQRSKMGFLI